MGLHRVQLDDTEAGHKMLGQLGSPEHGQDKLLAFSNDTCEPEDQLASGTQKQLEKKPGAGNVWGTGVQLLQGSTCSLLSHLTPENLAGFGSLFPTTKIVLTHRPALPTG